jgi:hypothetical protein
LIDLINQIQTKDVLERNEAALAGAQEIMPVFVPTEAYNRAWQILRKNHFVVLTGPPEMGKTSIVPHQKTYLGSTTQSQNKSL